MSFHTADALVAAQGINLAALRPYHPEDESLAADILTAAIPTSLGEGYQRLVQLANVYQGLAAPLDECLHCLLNLPQFRGTGGLKRNNGEVIPVYGMVDENDRTMMNIRRIAMFDVPRKLFAEKHGLWVYWLYGGAFVLSSTEQVDLDWAFRRHAYRLQWKRDGVEPKTEAPAEFAKDYVRDYLLEHAGAGLERLREDLRKEREDGIPMNGIPVKGPLFEPVTQWFGSLTGRELLKEQLGLQQPFVTYNCCKATTDLTASVVKQLQNQDPKSRDC